jgi:hypothetical protein
MESPLRSRNTSLLLSTALLILVLPGTALGSAQIRFLHAVPGVGEATLTADGQPVGSAAFGRVSAAAAVDAGPATFVLEAPGGVTLTKRAKLAEGASYTVVGLASGNSAELDVYRNGAADPGRARLRMIHAAPELGDANLALNGKVVAERAGYTEATQYWTLPPGREKLTVLDPSSEEMALGMRSISLAAGTATSAYVVGSSGERVKVVLVDDTTTAPAAAPATGLGGLALRDGGGPNWALAAAAALAVGGVIALLRRRRASA